MRARKKAFLVSSSAPRLHVRMRSQYRQAAFGGDAAENKSRRIRQLCRFGEKNSLFFTNIRDLTYEHAEFEKEKD